MRRCSRTAPELTPGGVNMVFAGEKDDPATVDALNEMGYARPEQVLAIVRGWHHGRYPAVRSPRARERLTEVQPLLIAALADTADPDRALASFDRFLSELPSGVQLFSLLRANPSLLRLLADIMGTAPRLAQHPLTPAPAARCRARPARAWRDLPTAEELDTIIAARDRLEHTTCRTCSTARASSAASSSSSSAFACCRAPSRPTRQAVPMRCWPNA